MPLLCLPAVPLDAVSPLLPSPLSLYTTPFDPAVHCLRYHVRRPTTVRQLKTKCIHTNTLSPAMALMAKKAKWLDVPRPHKTRAEQNRTVQSRIEHEAEAEPTGLAGAE